MNPLFNVERITDLEEVLVEVWNLMGHTVCDPASAHLEQALTKLDIEHEALFIPEEENKSEVGEQIKDFLTYSAKSLNG